MSWYPGAVKRQVSYETAALSASKGLILHVQQGNNSCFNEFNNRANGAMSHWWVSKTGVVEQYQDAALQSWAQMAGNSAYHSVETEGFDTEPLTAAQVSALTALYAWGHTTFGWPLVPAETPGQAGFGWHGMGGAAWGGHTGCPGNLRKPARAVILAALTEEDDDLPSADDVVNELFTRMAAANAALKKTPVVLNAEETLTIQAFDLVATRVAEIEAAAKTAK